MCGIAGVINASFYDKNAEDFIKDACTLGSIRGYDSTGIFQTDQKGELFAFKDDVPGMYFPGLKGVSSFLRDAARSPLTVIHHRAATTGAVSKKNAHPFIVQYKDGNKDEVLVGVHNGSLTGWKNKPDANKFEVDSEWALNHIQKHGPAAFKDIDGPYCFVWADSAKPGKLFMIRNHHRPMHLLYSKNKSHLYFASEAGMLNWIAERNTMEVANDILSLSTGRLYTFDTSGADVTYTSELLANLTAAAPVKSATTTPAAVKTNVTPITPTATKPANVDGLNAEGARFIQGIKDAANYVKPEINTVLIGPPVETDKNKKAIPLEAAIDEAVDNIVGQRDDDSPPFRSGEADEESNTDRVPLSWFAGNVQVSEEERALAVKWDFFRELQWLEGVAYETSSGEVLGDVDVFQKGQGKVKFVGVLRGVSEARANTQYINNGKNGVISGDWVVVVGAREDKVMGKVLIVAELNRHGQQRLNAQMHRNTVH